ncbi:EF-P lysine aminoacylase EpmA [Undibacter mobilis]|uniref:EF-P lysine aminoacylase GenX n=1 Tax=Undibacter mobilis TaxID=2292256 RepID=A0A371B0D7_9BRAD|nr:EF-P lysine aminoacylase EpmA [Undibacter mobilis]RDV01018.1 EF-P lysine aminoacylase GenX [Undibacter mobilis]
MAGNQPNFWLPGRHAARRPYLLARGQVMAALRAWFAGAGFLEVETAVLQVSPGNETHLHAFSTGLIGPDTVVRPRYLRTSPEFACKKLLAAGETRIVDFARVFRNRERGALHHPEFTMIEWYRANEPYEALMDDCAALIAVAARATGRARFAYRGREIDPFAAPQRLTVAEAFAHYAGIDLLGTIHKGEGDRDRLAREAAQAGIAYGSDDDWGDIFSRILVEKIEPHLGNERATILYEYPLPQAALARAKPSTGLPGGDKVAERFEIYACGIELGNAFAELTDAGEQRRRFNAAMDEKERIHGERYPIDEDFLDALATMPPASGIALGFERLAMLAAGAEHIEQVIWTPVQE